MIQAVFGILTALSLSDSGLAAVDGDGLAGQIGGTVGGQQGNQSVHLTGVADPLQGNQTSGHLGVILGLAGHQLGQEEAGGDGVDRDVIGGELPGPAPGQLGNGALGGPVGHDGAGHAGPQTIHGGDVDAGKLV